MERMTLTVISSHEADSACRYAWYIGQVNTNNMPAIAEIKIPSLRETRLKEAFEDINADNVQIDRRVDYLSGSQSCIAHTFR